MKITVFGTGYVGLVTGTCLADVGHEVLCVDVDEAKIAGLLRGVVPLYEPRLSALVEKNVAEGRLGFTTDPGRGVGFGILQLIAVGTPPDEDGSADLSHVLAAGQSEMPGRGREAAVRRHGAKAPQLRQLDALVVKRARHRSNAKRIQDACEHYPSSHV